MRALLWKDWRLVRPLLIATGLLYLTPLFVWAISVTSFEDFRFPAGWGAWALLIASISSGGCCASLLAAPALSAVMFSKERRERSAELAATLPIPRNKVVVSKAIVVAAATALPWLVTFAIVTAARGTLPGKGQSVTEFNQFRNDLNELILPFAGMTTLGVGMGWLFSSVLRSEGAAAGLAILITGVAAIVIAVLAERFALPVPRRIALYTSVSFPIGIAGLVVGTVIALVRKTP